MPPRWPISRPAAFASAGLRPHADRQHDDVRRVGFPGSRQDPERTVAGLLEPCHAVVQLEPDTVLHQVSLDEARHLGVERRHHLVELLDERHVESEVGEVLQHLEADEPAADHHRALRLRHGLEPRVRVHPRQDLVAMQPLADGPGIRDGPQREDPGQVDAGKRRPDRRRAGRQHELVVGLGGHLAGRHVPEIDGLVLPRNGNRLAAGPGIDREEVPEPRHRRHEQARLFRNHAPDVVGQPAVRVRHVRPAFDHDDLGLLVHPAQPRRARRAAGHSAHDDDFHDFIPRYFTSVQPRPGSNAAIAAAALSVSSPRSAW